MSFAVLNVSGTSKPESGGREFHRSGVTALKA